MKKDPVFTFQARIPDHPAFAEFAEIYGRMERTLFANISAGSIPGELKSDFISRFRVPARLFNSASYSLRGKIASRLEAQKE